MTKVPLNIFLIFNFLPDGGKLPVTEYLPEQKKT